MASAAERGRGEPCLQYVVYMHVRAHQWQALGPAPSEWGKETTRAETKQGKRGYAM